ncbi:hypothetical protein DERF_014675 [Dermatophagoides farinae]|uniref:C2H2-type domain-containing protein n=1 Tax=Dermatophagoides farinae TaxID=6954 RepID=A0A922HPI3_DERFA|nr:hypothetical protein DERF_014675 [Dermatophagoides farinae]
MNSFVPAYTVNGQNIYCEMEYDNNDPFNNGYQQQSNNVMSNETISNHQSVNYSSHANVNVMNESISNSRRIFDQKFLFEKLFESAINQMQDIQNSEYKILEKKFDEIENQLMSRVDKIENKVNECSKNVESLADDFIAHRQHLLDHPNLLKPIRRRRSTIRARPIQPSPVWTIEPITEIQTIESTETLFQNETLKHLIRECLKENNDLYQNRQNSLSNENENNNQTLTNTIEMGENSKQFHCSLCSFSYETEEILNRHLKTHLPGHNHACEYCGNLFKSKYTLSVHILIHTNERPFKCDLCDYSSNYKSSLKEHQRVKHSGQKYECDHCDYKCGTKSSYYRHIRKHS